jgi:AP2 domain.
MRNKIIFDGDTCRVELTQQQWSIIDSSDVGMISDFRWCATRHNELSHFYAMSESFGKRIFMHRLISNPPDGMDVDHINRNALDNRRCNLRHATRSQNLANSIGKQNRKYGSKYKGVYFSAKDKSWYSSIKVNGVQKWLGTFSDQIAAANAYRIAAIKYFGEFARPTCAEDK